MWIGRADGAGWTFPRATVLAIPLLCLLTSVVLYVVSRPGVRGRPGVPHTGELESDDIPRFTRCLEGLSETQYAVATLLSSELYVPGAFALGRSIQEHLPGDYQLIAMVLEGHEMSEGAMDMVRRGGWKICETARIKPPEEEERTNIFAWGFWNGKRAVPARYKDQFTKLGLWSWETFDRIVYLDSDCLVVGDISELFSAPSASFAAVRDWTGGSFQQGFNMGVFSLRPSVDEFRYLMEQKAAGGVKYDAWVAEQGFLNGLQFPWEEIPWRYNGGIGMYLLDPEQWSEYAADIRVIHFTREKPFVRFKDDLGSGVDPACDDVKHALTEKPFEYWKCVYEEWMLEV
jgi:hypothetical protein